MPPAQAAITLEPARRPYRLLFWYESQRGDWQRHGGRNDGYRRYKSGEREIRSAEVMPRQAASGSS